MPLSDLPSLRHLSLSQLRAKDPALADEVSKLVGPTATRGPRKQAAPRPEQPVGMHPAVGKLVEQQRIDELLRIASLADDVRGSVQAVALDVGIDDASLTKLVQLGTLTETQARKVGVVAAIAELADGDTALTDTLSTNITARLGREIADVRELASLTVADWRGMLNKAQLPDGATVESVADAIASRVEAAFPGPVLAARLPRPTEAELARRLGDVANELSGIANAYPGLDLAATFDDAAIPIATRAAIAEARIGLVNRILDELDTASLLELDLSAASLDRTELGLDQIGASAADEARAISTLKAYQRVVAITDSIDDAVALVAAGFSSSLSIAKLSFEHFAERSGFPRDKARGAYEGALAGLTSSTLTTSAIFDATADNFGLTAVNNVQTALIAKLKQLPGYEALFGKLSLCACEECSSILGAAAYFVDLMKFVDDNIRDQLTSKPNHVLDIKTRRPDLWELRLTCANTNERIPTLEIVNEILENHIARDQGYNGSLADRSAIRAVVYSKLASNVDSFKQPFHLPLTRLESYLRALGGDRRLIAVATGASAARQAQATLGISNAEWPLITEPKLGLWSLAQLYNFPLNGTVNAVEPIDAMALITATGLDRTRLGEAIATGFVKAGAPNARIVASKSSTTSVQNDTERVLGFTADGMDRLHRLVRLQRRFPWSFAELDRVLTAINTPALDGPALTTLAKLRVLELRLGLKVDELCAIISDLPLVPNGESLFDRRFNPPSFVASDGKLPAPNRKFIDPALRTTTAATADPALPRLVAGLGLDLAKLSALIRHLAPQLERTSGGFLDITAPADDDREVALSLRNLSLLYRHTVIARKLGVSIDDMFVLLEFAGLDYLGDLDAVERLLDLHAWWRTTRYKLDEIAIALGRTPRDPSHDGMPAAIAAEIVAAATDALVVKDTLFAVSPGVSEAASRELVAANAALFETIEGAEATAYRLRPDIDLETAELSIPASAQIRDAQSPSGVRTATDIELKATLKLYLPSQVAIAGIASALRLDVAKTKRLIALTGLSPGAAMSSALAGNQIESLVALVSAVRTLSIVFAGAAWTADALVMATATPALFGAEPLPLLSPAADRPHAPSVSLAQLRALSAYTRLVDRMTVVGGVVAPVDPLAVREALLGFDPATQEFQPAAEPAVARALGVPLSMVIGLRGRVVLADVAAQALDGLERATQIASALGVDGETFAGIAGANFEELDRVADALVAALRERNPDEETRAKVTDDAEQPVREAQRDALCDFMLQSVTPRPWKSLDDLYKYFLIDVNAGGCASTSRVVAAISSVQLYVHRVQMNLEQDTLPPTNQQHAMLALSDDAAEEWTWRQNFRVWQANRKVFLWPENYMEPDLRDDKTPQFRELEEELLQKDIDDQNVLDAYTRYLASFEEVASLLVAGAYHERKRGSDTLHLIGVAPQDPPVYYYRSCRDLIASGLDPKRGAVWTPWQKISVQIPGRRVAPIVHNGRLHVFWATLRSKPVSKIVDGKSVFNGYSHRYVLSFTMLRADGTWTSPQPVSLPQTYNFWPSSGEVLDELVDGVPEHDPQRRVHEEAIDDYTLGGPSWDGVWPTTKGGNLYIRMRNFIEPLEVDLFARAAEDNGPGFPTKRPTFLCAKEGKLYFGNPLPLWEGAGVANLIIDAKRLDLVNLDVPGVGEVFKIGLYKEHIANIPDNAELLAVPGAAEDAIVQVGHDVLLVQGTTRADDHYQLRRIGTTLARTIARTLFEDGVDALLETDTQLALAEHGLPISLVGSRIDDTSNSGTLDFTGPYGVYYRELFFHIPFLIANALNSQGRFAAAQSWYHRIFNPTSTEKIKILANMPASERAHRALDRVWRYREFRGLDITTMRDILTDKATIATYKNDPFNPFAIARSRISAFQKSIVMKYLDNLLDWADDLFTQFSMESVNEALMLYVTALDILGKRPTILGDCGEGGPSPRTYATIGPLLDESSEMLMETENWGIRPIGKKQRLRPKYTLGQSGLKRRSANPLMGYRLAADQVATRSRRESSSTRSGDRSVDVLREGSAFDENAFELGNTIGGLSRSTTRTSSWSPSRGTGVKASRASNHGRFVEAASRPTLSKVGRFGWAFLRQLRPVFCVPPNTDLLEYWDRVEDRLYKIRNCMDITGQLRELALFAPPIDPRILVAARAAGLSLHDVVASSRGSLPPYRFSFLIERAKAAAASLSGFGSALLAALEKRDGEEINRLRLVQQKNIATMSRSLRQLEVNAADASLEATRRQLAAAEYRYEYYENLVTSGRNTWETFQSIGQHASSLIYIGVGITNTVAAIAHLIPEVGSPFAMKYGGKQVGDSSTQFGAALQAGAMMGDALAKSAGLEAGFERREEGWSHQRELAKHDVGMLKRQVKAAEIRLDQANRSLVLHEKGQENLDEQLEVLDGKFTNLGLYTWLAQRVQSLYRTAYQNASSLARLAEQAYRFERNDTSFTLEPNYWDSTRAGLLSGESLLVALQALDRRFLEANTRSLEVDQAFSMAQLDPGALVVLRETGQCSFTIPEVAFDLFYPGQYRRRIKAVRLTIPCITGPYVNVGATLALSRSWLRASTSPTAQLIEVPPSRSVAIATSAAQGDAGVFELSFRDERYMPFEGLGAISEWQITLPRAFRQFDYQTINDVIVTISYTADHDGALRDRVESQNASLVGGILNHFTENTAQRLYSLRQDFSAVFTRLLRSPVGTQLAFEISDRSLPLLFKGREIEVTQAMLLVRTAPGSPPTGLVVAVDGASVTGFAPSAAFGGLHAAPMPASFGPSLRGPHTIAVGAAGEMGPLAEGGETTALDVDRVLDLLVHVQYRLV